MFTLLFDIGEESGKCIVIVVVALIAIDAVHVLWLILLLSFVLQKRSGTQRLKKNNRLQKTVATITAPRRRRHRRRRKNNKIFNEQIYGVQTTAQTK